MGDRYGKILNTKPNRFCVDIINNVTYTWLAFNCSALGAATKHSLLQIIGAVKGASETGSSNLLMQWYSTCFVRVLPDVIFP
jgi:hypothetical protein